MNSKFSKLFQKEVRGSLVADTEKLLDFQMFQFSFYNEKKEEAKGISFQDQVERLRDKLIVTRNSNKKIKIIQKIKQKISDQVNLIYLGMIPDPSLQKVTKLIKSFNVKLMDEVIKFCQAFQQKLEQLLSLDKVDQLFQQIETEIEAYIKQAKNNSSLQAQNQNPQIEQEASQKHSQFGSNEEEISQSSSQIQQQLIDNQSQKDSELQNSLNQQKQQAENFKILPQQQKEEFQQKLYQENN